ncbi:MAG: DUF11 domain-containing protein [Chloroflexi bacterium]|nr:DUF11 domain-containing protein [Chloroflexota bacterium]
MRRNALVAIVLALVVLPLALSGCGTTVQSATKIAFTTSARTNITFGVISPVITIQTQDSSGNAADVDTDTTIDLSSTSVTGVFDTYKDATVGTPTITASCEDLTSASQVLGIIGGPASKIVFTTSAQTSISAGQASAVMTIQLQDALGDLSNVSTYALVNLTSTSAAGRFDTSASGAFDGTIVSVIIGKNSANFFYKDTTVGTPTITASSSGLTSASQQEGIIPCADLAVTAAANRSAPNEGDQLIYTVAVKNNGPSDATGITITGTLPSGVTYVSSSPSLGSYANSTGVWTVGSLSNGTSATLSITVTVNAGTGGQTIDYLSNVTAADQGDGKSTNNTATVTITVPSADLDITNAASTSTPSEGGTIVYTVTLKNNGPSNATSVTASSPLPAGLTYVSSSPSLGSYDSSGGKWTVGDLSFGASATLTITVTVTVGTGGATISQTASVTHADQADGGSTNNSATAAITVNQP